MVGLEKENEKHNLCSCLLSFCTARKDYNQDLCLLSGVTDIHDCLLSIVSKEWIFLQFKIWALVLTRRVKHELSRVTLTFSFFYFWHLSRSYLQMVEKPWISIDYKTVDVLFRRVNKCSSEYRVLLVRRVFIFLINYGSLYKLENFEKKSCFRSDT